MNDRRSYDAWGSVRAQQSPGAPTLRYCGNLGHRQDDESGLVTMRARYYEPTSGRFISEDPARDGGNWFAYCSNNPVNASDADGRKAIDPVMQAAIVGMLFGFFQALAQDGTLSMTSILGGAHLDIVGEIQSGAWGAASAWALAFVGQHFLSTEGLANRIPLRIGYARGFGAVALTGVGMGVVMAVAKRSGEVMAVLFELDHEAGG